MEEHPVPADRLRRRLDPSTLPFNSTLDVSPLVDTLGQERAMESLHFGIGIDSPGYNLFVTGVSGSGRTGMVGAFLNEIAATLPVPGDWVYVHDFDEVDRPAALNLPAGRGREPPTGAEPSRPSAS